MASDTVEIRGLAELQRALDSLPVKVETNLMRGALRAGCKVIAKAARAKVNNRSGKLAKSIKFGASPDKRAGKVQGYVRVGGRKKGAAFYAHMVEYGTAAHLIKARNGKALAIGGGAYAEVHHPGARPQPFMRPALDTQQQAALQAVAEYLRQRLALKHGIDVPAPLDPEAEA